MSTRIATLRQLTKLTKCGRGAPSLPEKVALMKALRDNGEPDTPRQSDLDAHLLGEIERMYRGLNEANSALDEASKIMEKLSAAPWFPAVFIELVEIAVDGTHALVFQDRNSVLVNIADDVDPATLQRGDAVFLSVERNTIMAKAPDGMCSLGESAIFDRKLDDGRLVLRHHDDEVIVYAGAGLRGVELKQGDVIRWNQSACIAHEKLDRVPGTRFMVDEVPDIDPSAVGGQSINLDLLFETLMATLGDPKLREDYKLDGNRSVLMVGPPGCGKTLMARIVIAAIRRKTKKNCRICIVKPGAFEDPYVGVTQRNIRECFEALAEAAKEGYVILFLDEAEGAGRIRGGISGQHADKFLDALLPEIDGFSHRGNIAIIAATNRPDLMDPALIDRLSDVRLEVNRPDMASARAIFDIHLDDEVPWYSNGVTASTTREKVIDTAISRFYSPNAENKLCTLRFRDGTTREIFPRDLISGRIIEQTCIATRNSALIRNQSENDRGIRVEDIDAAVTATIERLRQMLSPSNCHAYLSDLPQDLDVVAVDREMPPVNRPMRYYNVA